MFEKATLVKTFDPATLVRVGIGLVLAYAGILALVDPGTFSYLVPAWLVSAISIDVVVSAHGVLSLILGAFLLAGVWVPAAAVTTALDFAAILVCYGIDETTFGLVGLMFASLALLTLTLRKSKNEEKTAA